MGGMYYMVEQVRISPEEVRGYGNICEEHSLDDFIVSSSGLAKEKENVHGTLTEVYKLVYSLYGLIFSFDKGNKQLYLHSDNDAVVVFGFREKSLVFKTTSHIGFGFVDGSLVVYDENYLFFDPTGDTSKYIYDSRCNVTSSNNEITVTWVSGTYNFWANKPGTTSSAYDYTGDFTVEFDLLSNGNNASIQIYDGSASTYYSKSLNQLNGMNAGHFKIVKEGQLFRTYIDGVEKTNHQINSNITNACRVGFIQNSASTIKFKNLQIYDSTSPYLFIDEGTTASHNDHWYINSYGTATVQDNGTKLLNTSGNTSFVMRNIIPSNKTTIEANSYSYNPPYIVEFDIVETDGTSSSNAQVQIHSQQSTGNFSQDVTTGHYKIEVKEDEQKIWLDDTLINTTNLSLPNARITLRVRNGKYLIYKNFKVY